MILNKSETPGNRDSAHLVKNAIENLLNAELHFERENAAKIAFIAGMRWMEIYWKKSMQGPGSDKTRRLEWKFIKEAARQFPHKKQIEQIRIGIEKFELATGKKCNRTVESFQKTFSRHR